MEIKLKSEVHSHSTLIIRFQQDTLPIMCGDTCRPVPFYVDDQSFIEVRLRLSK
jgi:hypothetical protein